MLAATQVPGDGRVGLLLDRIAEQGNRPLVLAALGGLRGPGEQRLQRVVGREQMDGRNCQQEESQ